MLEFKLGRRPNPEHGMHYPSRCGRYLVVNGDRVCGMELKGLMPIRWLAIEITPHGQRVISKHEKQETAIEACEKHAKGQK